MDRQWPFQRSSAIEASQNSFPSSKTFLTCALVPCFLVDLNVYWNWGRDLIQPKHIVRNCQGTDLKSRNLQNNALYNRRNWNPLGKVKNPRGKLSHPAFQSSLTTHPCGNLPEPSPGIFFSGQNMTKFSECQWFLGFMATLSCLFTLQGSFIWFTDVISYDLDTVKLGRTGF